MKIFLHKLRRFLFVSDCNGGGRNLWEDVALRGVAGVWVAVRPALMMAPPPINLRLLLDRKNRASPERAKFSVVWRAATAELKPHCCRFPHRSRNRPRSRLIGRLPNHEENNSAKQEERIVRIHSTAGTCLASSFRLPAPSVSCRGGAGSFCYNRRCIIPRPLRDTRGGARNPNDLRDKIGGISDIAKRMPSAR